MYRFSQKHVPIQSSYLLTCTFYSISFTMNKQAKKPNTHQAIIDRHQCDKFAIPTEITRTREIINPPTLEAQKLFKYMIQQSGKHITERKIHHFFLSDLNTHKGFAHHDRKSLEKLFAQLGKFIIITREGLNFSLGTMLQEAHSRDTYDGKILISYEFGSMFIKMVKHSQLFTIIDSSAVYHFKHSHTMQLYDFIASIYKMPNYTSQKFTLIEFKKLFGLSKTSYSLFPELKRSVIDPTFKDLNEHVHSFSASYKTIKTGRKTTHILISWKQNKSKTDHIVDRIKQTTENLKSYKKIHDDPMQSFSPKQDINDPWRIHCQNILGIKISLTLKDNFPNGYHIKIFHLTIQILFN